MRTWGRIYNELGQPSWQMVTTNAAGFDDEVWIVTLAQTLKLNLGESPIFGNYGIPAHQSVMTRVFPDFYVAFTQQNFAQYFASLTVAKVTEPYPAYRIGVTTKQGFMLNASVPIPT